MAFRSKIAAVVLAAGLFPLGVHADEVTATGTLVMKDKFHTQTEWGENLKLPRQGHIVRVMDGTYGFEIRNASGSAVAQFLAPQQAVGLSLPAGEYQIVPYVCTRHRHHHVEVTAEY
jgi:hypothetical protein